MPLHHIGFEVRDFDQSLQWYAKALSPIGYSITNDFEHGPVKVGSVGSSREDSPLWISKGVPGKTNFGQLHLAFNTNSHSVVNEFHKAGLAAGGECNGPPGPRPQYHEHYYAAFVRDPDGNNVEVVCHDPEGGSR
ncbi:hypothetical protein WJX73_004723 [Symbiochloris irregularis]|uniref:VOC domain-containing protein n=1 Tax=Symbiochloris irregularis TaxID=706552 RepID=A0AAW1PZ43_9CHLO